MSSSRLKVGFVTARWSSRDPEGTWTEAGVARLLDVLADEYSELHVAMAVSERKLELHDHLLPTKNTTFHPLPWLPSVVGGLPKSVQVARVIAKIERRCDVVIAQLPFAALPALFVPHRARVYHLCANLVELVNSSPYYRGRRGPPARALAQGLDLAQRALMSRRAARVVANGHELFERYQVPGETVVSATLLDREILSVPRARTGGMFRMLFVGYLRHEKGVGTLFAACEALAQKYPGQLELMIVGVPHSEDRGMAEEVRIGFAALQSRIKVTFSGHLPFGPKLFQCFADADVLLLPSLSEGTPRVLIEARAFGCPVVATRVGGIPSSVDDGVDGVLVPRGDAKALAAAVARLIDDPRERRRLSEAGVARARRHTVEAMVAALKRQVAAADEAAR